MYKLYCLLHRFRLRWSYAGTFDNYEDIISTLYYSNFHTYWGSKYKYYKVTYNNSILGYFKQSPNSKHNTVEEIKLNDIQKDIMGVTA